MKDELGVICDGCGVMSPAADIDENVLDNGWVLPYDRFGYYGGFDDNIDVLIGGDSSRYWLFCHDCVVKFLRTFPRLAEGLGRGCHPCIDAEPCCEFAWQPTELWGKNVSGVQIRYGSPDGWVDGPYEEH